MATINDIFKVLQQIQTNSQNLSKDVDPSDSREETRVDLRDLSNGFNKLKVILQSLNESDKQKLKEEMHELTSGKQTIFEYSRDVNALLADVHNRTKQHDDVKTKIQNNIPVEAKEKNVDGLFGAFKKILSEINNLSEKAARR